MMLAIESSASTKKGKHANITMMETEPLKIKERVIPLQSNMIEALLRSTVKVLHLSGTSQMQVARPLERQVNS